MKAIVTLMTLLTLSQANSAETEWVEAELTENFMRSITKDQCIEKTVASLQKLGPHLSNLRNMAGITGDCVAWAQGTERAFCESFKENYIREICSTNMLDARDCIILHDNYEIVCTEPKHEY